MYMLMHSYWGIFYWENILSGCGVKPSVLRQPIDVCHIRVHLKKQYDLKKKEFTLTASSASFMSNLHHHHIDCWSRTRRRKKSSRRALCFLLWGCVVLCLPKPPPHHIPELTTTEFARAVHGAWKQTGAAMSHNPKVCFSWFSLFPNLDFQIFCLLHQKVSNFEHFLFYENGGWVYVHILYCSNERCCVGFWYDLGFVWFLN